MDYSEPERYRCPEGHSTWFPVSHGTHSSTVGSLYYCPTCKEHYTDLVDVIDDADA